MVTERFFIYEYMQEKKCMNQCFGGRCLAQEDSYSLSVFWSCRIMGPTASHSVFYKLEQSFGHIVTIYSW